MGAILVHEFTTLDGNADAPTEAYDNGVIHLGYAPSPQTG